MSSNRCPDPGQKMTKVTPQPAFAILLKTSIVDSFALNSCTVALLSVSMQKIMVSWWGKSRWLMLVLMIPIQPYWYPLLIDNGIIMVSLLNQIPVPIQPARSPQIGTAEVTARLSPAALGPAPCWTCAPQPWQPRQPQLCGHRVPEAQRVVGGRLAEDLRRSGLRFRYLESGETSISILEMVLNVQNVLQLKTKTVYNKLQSTQVHRNTTVSLVKWDSGRCIPWQGSAMHYGHLAYLILELQTDCIFLFARLASHKTWTLQLMTVWPAYQTETSASLLHFVAVTTHTSKSDSTLGAHQHWLNFVFPEVSPTAGYASRKVSQLCQWDFVEMAGIASHNHPPAEAARDKWLWAIPASSSECSNQCRKYQTAHWTRTVSTLSRIKQ